jgi:rRNA methylase
MTQETLLDRFHVVLVEPENSLNIGAVARAMMNLGFRHLHLVAPPQYDRERADVTARNARVLLDAMTIHETFEEALAGMEEVVGLSLRGGKDPAHFVTLPEWSRALPTRPALPKTALVFGTEDNGLRQDHLDHCRWIIRIPSTDAFDSFNLAQSVLLVLYEITKALPDAAAPLPALSTAERATGNDFAQLDRHLDAIMREIGFARADSPPRVPGLLKNLFRRMDLSPQEMGVLLAFVARVNKTLQRRRGSGGDLEDG